MLKPALVPSPLSATAAHPELEISTQPVQLKWRKLFIVQQIMSHLAGVLLRGLRGGSDGADEARRLRERMQRMGMLWVKVGQLLSLRVDLFSAEFCDELSKLQYKAIGFPSHEAVACIAGSLARPAEEVFERIELQPIAAASIAQVHRARLRAGHQDVVVKVRRPGVDEAFRKDMGVLRLLVRILELVRFHPQLRLREGIWELERIMEEELDYRVEASNLERLRKGMRARKAYSPKPYPDYSSSAILVMEFIPGVLMSELIAVTRRDPARARAWQEENGVKPKAVARRLYFLMLRQIIDDNLFHADLHPGNIMVLRGGRIALIDFGSVGSLDRRFIRLYAANLHALASRDYGRTVRLTLKMCEPLPPIDVDDVTRRLMRVYRAWDARAAIKQASYHQRSLSSVENDAARVLFAHKIASDWALLRMSRTWGTLDSTLAFLMPDADYRDLLRRFFSERSSGSGMMAGAVCGPLAAFMGEATSSLAIDDELVFQQSATKWELFAASCLRLLALLLFVAGAAIAIVNAEMVRRLPILSQPPISGVLESVPKLPLGAWLLVTALVLIAIRACLRLARQFARVNPVITRSGS